MKQSENMKEDIEAVLAAKPDKSKIAFNTEILDLMVDLKAGGQSKDEIIFACMSIELLKPKVYEMHWNEAGCKASGGSGYRQRTVQLFLDSDGAITKKEWEKDMVDGGYLKSIVNYRQHFDTFHHLYHHTQMK